MASFYFRYGAMNCGKTTALLQVAHNYEEKGMKIVLLKPLIDTKGNHNVVSRLGISRQVDYLIGSDTKIMEIASDWKENRVACILVDEAQFLSEEQIIDLYRVSKYYDIPVICYGLRSTFLGKDFTGSGALLRWADQTDELITICSCGKKAKFSARKVNGEYVMDGDDVLIDGTESVEYEPMCGMCYLEKVYDKGKVKVKK